MGTDRLEIYRGKCPCGAGDVSIVFCTPDHPWPTQSKWFETSISCGSCSKKYSLVEQNKAFVLIEKEEEHAREELWREYLHRSKALLSSPEVGELLQELEGLLEYQPSMAACHRILSAHGLDYYSIGTFRKKWSGASDWIKNNIGVHNLENVMKLLGKGSVVIERELRSLEELYENYKKPFPIIGTPLVDVSNYRD
ncbi:MAG: hypothetical protein JRG77_07730 [Deltaproteobacteria bacterium]|nr:hypothetical protein [Deltaproteobacteria bacterium]